MVVAAGVLVPKLKPPAVEVAGAVEVAPPKSAGVEVAVEVLPPNVNPPAAGA